VSFVFAWFWAGKRTNHAAKAMKETGMSDQLIDEYYKKMSKPTWMMSIRVMLVTGTILGIIASIICAIVVAGRNG
jgi:hypothetical protein